MHANPTLQLIRLATHPTLTPISENTGFSENYLLMIEISNCVIVYFILPASLMKTKLLTVRKGVLLVFVFHLSQMDPVLTAEVEAVVER